MSRSHRLHILICGEPRSIDYVVNHIKQIIKCTDTHEVSTHFYVCTNADFSLPSQDDIHLFRKKLIIQDKHDNSYRNALNYANKIHHGLKLLELDIEKETETETETETKDIYIIMRSDCIIEDLGIALDDILSNTLYVSSTRMNQFTKDIKERINENIVITRSFQLLNQYYLYMMQPQNTNYLDVGLYNYIRDMSISFVEIPIKYRLVLRKCNMIAISGDSGSGKTTLMRFLQPLLENKENKENKERSEDTLMLETDRYHKWERGNINYNTYTHLNPIANHIDKMCEDVYQLKIGNEIFQVDYNHETGTFTSKEKIEAKQNVIICGLHTLYHSQMNEILDLKIFMDTDRNLIRYWKIQRDIKERGYNIEKVLNQMRSREEDYEKYIKIQKEMADIVIHFYTPTHIQNVLLCNNDNDIHDLLDLTIELQCKVVIQNEKMISKVLHSAYIDNNISFRVYKNENNHLEISLSGVGIGEKELFYHQIFDLIKKIN